MKTIIMMLVALLGLLQYELWFADGGMYSAYHLRQNTAEQQLRYQQLLKRNAAMVANIEDLKHGKEALEEHARYDLGMVKKNEQFYQVIQSEN